MKSNTNSQVAPRETGVKHRVLIVENDDSMQALLGHLLREAGYEVAQAGDRQQAARSIAEAEGKDDLILVVDVVLDGESGLDIADDFVRAKASSRILFISGYTSDVLFLNRQIPIARTAFLRKPLSKDEFLKAIAELAAA